ncbi:hypothetical protein UVI_02043320 [Ustilaginoidea virens]|uniref:Uncharacterized protein n=1 Tax=Ustilaginoidea virens TaxID=1159556 RepID=A0A1B5KXH2_USTVR|nr:hypothetical protein UVI_02043320 [Ustilaginoidea virens]
MDGNATPSAFTSMLVSSTGKPIHIPSHLDIVREAVTTTGFWTILLTLFAACVVYDQSSIVGPTWKMPFIGPFLQSMHPKFDEYYAKWASGPLSCVSVFHKCVIISPASAHPSLGEPVGSLAWG